MPIFLKANHQLESRMPAIGQSGSEGGAKSAFVPTPIVIFDRAYVDFVHLGVLNDDGVF